MKLRTNRIRCLLCAAAALLSLGSPALPAGAVIIDFGDGTGNTNAPADDPGFDNVGNRGSLSAVYLGDGWIIAPAHVSVGTTTFLGVGYEAVAGTVTVLDNGDGTSPDLMVWGIYPYPPLPSLAVRSLTSLPAGEVVMIGNGRNRGAATDTNDLTVYVPPPTINPPLDGFVWAGTKAIRWGSNKITAAWPGDPFDTVTFYSTFDKNGFGRTTYEAQAAEGDSGGAVFSKETGGWELAGVMFIISLLPGDPTVPGSGQQLNSAIHTNLTGIIDLSFYYDQIINLTAIPVPEPTRGTMLAAGLAFLATFGRRRARGASCGIANRAGSAVAAGTRRRNLEL